MRSLIVGTGSYAPEKVLTNADLEKLVETNDQWIVERTGIQERRMIADGRGDLRPRAARGAAARSRTRSSTRRTSR